MDGFAAKYPQYGKLARGDWHSMFKFIMRPETFLRAVAVTDALGIPAVSGIANDFAALARKDFGELSGTMKQFAGASICALMEENGFEKTGTKRSISCNGWSKGEVYNPTEKRFTYPR